MNEAVFNKGLPQVTPVTINKKCSPPPSSFLLSVDNCPHKAVCADCHGPHLASHFNCPAAPRRVNGHVNKPTITEMKALPWARRMAQQHLSRTVEETLRQSTLQPEATPQVTAQEALSPRPSTQRQEGDSTAALDRPINASHRSSSTANREKRPRRAVANYKSLNVEQLSASNMRPPLTTYTDLSNFEREDTSMSDDPPLTC
jgi:hypothetical protein